MHSINRGYKERVAAQLSVCLEENEKGQICEQQAALRERQQAKKALRDSENAFVWHLRMQCMV